MFSIGAAVFAEIWFGLEVEAVDEVFVHCDERIFQLLVLWHLLLLLIERPVLQRVAVRCSVAELQRVVVCYSVLHCVAACYFSIVTGEYSDCSSSSTCCCC